MRSSINRPLLLCAVHRSDGALQIVFTWGNFHVAFLVLDVITVACVSILNLRTHQTPLRL